MTAPAARPRASALTAVFAIAGFAAFRLPALVRYPPWTDEVWTIGLVRQPLVACLRSQADDQTQPPLFYALLWVWRAIGGDALAWLRLLPCLFGILLALPVLALCRRARLGPAATALALACTASSQVLVFYSNELRSYSLYALLAACSLVLWLRARESPAARDVVLLTIVNTLLVYTHYFGWLVIAAQWLDALVTARGRLRALTISSLAAGAVLLPWIAIVARRAMRSGNVLDNASWIPRPRLADFFDPYLRAVGISGSIRLDLLVLVALGGAITVFVARRFRDDPAVVPLASAAFVPSAMALAVSLMLPRSVWVARYLLATAVPFLVLAAAALTTLLPRRARRFAVVLACWPAALTVAALLDGREKVRFDQLADAIVAASPRGGADVFVLDWVEGGPLLYQAGRFDGALRVRFAPAVDSLTASSGWLVWSEHHPPRGLPPAASLRRRGYRADGPISVVGMWDEQVGRSDSVIAVPFHRSRP